MSCPALKRPAVSQGALHESVGVFVLRVFHCAIPFNLAVGLSHRAFTPLRAFLAAALAARAGKLPLFTCPPFFLAVAR